MKEYLKWYFINVAGQLAICVIVFIEFIIIVQYIISKNDIKNLDKQVYLIHSKMQFFLAEQRNCMYATDNSYWVNDSLKAYNASYVFGYLDRVGDYALIEPKEMIKLRSREN